jgi:predicted unusual protein kinase regulating ubiquinone biosynthesis (AarF/ABC1/UbiB family)
MSTFSRLAKLGTLTTKVGASYLSQRVAGVFQDEESRKAAMERIHATNAERIVGSLGALKGAAMKLGQAVAQAAEGLDLPPEAKAALSRLHDRAEPVPFDVIRARVEAELHGDIGVLYRRFDPEPIGTASLGQAHAAELPDGTPVVVKVLHEGVEASVASDLAALRTMLRAGGALNRPRDEMDAIFAEIRARLDEELDYRREAENLRRFRTFFAGDPEVTIPAVHDGWSTGKVLTMERIEGRPISVFAATAPDAARQRAGLALARSFVRMQYLLRTIHADPHPGNYLFLPDGRIGILDFGCVRTYDLAFMATYGGIGMDALADERESAMKKVLAIGALARRDPAAEDAIWEFITAIGGPFRGGPFTFGGPEDDVQDRIAAVVPRLVSSGATRQPRELIFLHRGLAGLHTLAKQLKVTADWHDMFVEHVTICMNEAKAAGIVIPG